MQFTVLAATLFASMAFAQGFAGLPACAVTCLQNNFVNTTCAQTDVACLCKDTTFYNDVELCVIGACTTTDAITTLNVVTADCTAASTA